MVDGWGGSMEIPVSGAGGREKDLASKPATNGCPKGINAGMWSSRAAEIYFGGGNPGWRTLYKLQKEECRMQNVGPNRRLQNETCHRRAIIRPSLTGFRNPGAVNAR